MKALINAKNICAHIFHGYSPETCDQLGNYLVSESSLFSRILRENKLKLEKILPFQSGHNPMVITLGKASAMSQASADFFPTH